MIATKVANIELRDSGIVYMEFPNKNQLISLADSHEIFNARVSLTPPETKQLILVDLCNNPKPDREARDFAKSEEMNNATTAMAMIIDSAISKVLGNFFIGFNKGEYPVKLFTNEAEAVDWLNSFK